MPRSVLAARISAFDPWASGAGGVAGAEPLPDRRGGELGAIVGANVIGGIALDEELGQEIQNIFALKLACDQDRQALPSVFVDHRQHPKDPTIIRPSEGL